MSFSYLNRLPQKTNPDTKDKTYIFCSQLLTIWSISGSDLLISSNQGAGVSTRTRRSPWTGWLYSLTALILVVHGSKRELDRLPGWPARVSMIFKACKNMKINVCHHSSSIAHMALSRSGVTHQPGPSVTVVSNILVNMGEAVYAMTRSLCFAAFLISSATKAITKQIYWGRFWGQCWPGDCVKPSR